MENVEISFSIITKKSHFQGITKTHSLTNPQLEKSTASNTCIQVRPPNHMPHFVRPHPQPQNPQTQNPQPGKSKASKSQFGNVILTMTITCYYIIIQYIIQQALTDVIVMLIKVKKGFGRISQLLKLNYLFKMEAVVYQRSNILRVEGVIKIFKKVDESKVSEVAALGKVEVQSVIKIVYIIWQFYS